ncbi:hypothetical protein ACFE04_003732 [Oxalis oulophora]
MTIINQCQGALKLYSSYQHRSQKLNNQFTIFQCTFEFSSYQQLEERVGDRTLLTDVLGQLTGIGIIEEVISAGKKTKLRKMELRMIGDKSIKLTFWNKCAIQIDNIVKYEISLSSTTSTKIYSNIQIPDTKEVLKRADKIENIITNMISTSNKPSDLEARMLKNRRTLQEIIDTKFDSSNQTQVFTVSATIVDLDCNSGWFYIACEICMKKLIKEGDHFTCKFCNRPSKYPTPRFKIHLKVTYHTATGTFTLFDRNAQTLLNNTASDLITTQADSDNDIPSLLRNLCNQNMIFEIQLTDRNFKDGWQNYTITKHSYQLMSWKFPDITTLVSHMQPTLMPSTTEDDSLIPKTYARVKRQRKTSKDTNDSVTVTGDHNHPDTSTTNTFT